jgi:hypothetical protein
MHNPESILIHDCVETYLEQWIETERQGHWAWTITEIQDQGIQSPPEQVWYAAALTHHLPRYAEVIPQAPIGPYRADFLVNVLGHFVNAEFVRYTQPFLERIASITTSYVIEIDGFEWHDKTPQQAESDKQRDRYMIQQRYQVLRFAAREVLRDPDHCIQEIVALCRAQLKEIYARFAISKHMQRLMPHPFEGLECTIK